MDDWEIKQNVHNYRMRSGHAINYYDGGLEHSPVNQSGEPYKGKKEVQKGSLAKSKMFDLKARSDSKANRAGKRRNVVTLENDI